MRSFQFGFSITHFKPLDNLDFLIAKPIQPIHQRVNLLIHTLNQRLNHPALDQRRARQLSISRRKRFAHAQHSFGLSALCVSVVK